MRTKTTSDRVEAFFGWVGVPVLSLVVLVVVGQDVVPSWRATHGHGTHGAFVATHRQCSTSVRWRVTHCGYYGTFVALDGSIRYEKIWLDSPPPEFDVGETTEVVYAGGRSPRAVYRQGSREWMVVVGLVLTAAAALGVWAFRLDGGRFPWEYATTRPPRRRRPRKRHRHHSSSRRGRRGSRPPP